MTYHLRVSLLDIEPEIWRRVIVPGDIDLGKLNHVIQAAMGWTNSHLHQFIVGPTVYSDLDFEFEDDDVVDEHATLLCEIAPRAKNAFIYEYDFGDSWDHLVVVEHAWARNNQDPKHPVCVEGARACPPEDVGGVPGYMEFLQAIFDPSHEEHASMLTWVGGKFDPDGFDLEEVNRRLRNVR